MVVFCIIQKMFRNIFGINPYPQRAIDYVVAGVEQCLKNTSDQDLRFLQIEFKYAEFLYFSNPFIEDIFRDQPEDARRRAQHLYVAIDRETNNHKHTLKEASRQTLIRLNNLGKAIYKIQARFNEDEHKQFYHIRQFLIKLCKYNEQNKIHASNHIYQQLSQTTENSTFRMFKENEVRLDIIIMNNEEMAGRYTYEVGAENPWTRILKISQIREQIDLYLCQKAFRLGINRQNQIQLSYSDLTKLQQLLAIQVNSKNYMVRLKRTLRVVKNDMVEFSLSEVYQPQKPHQELPDLKDMISADIDVREKYVLDNFTKFYKVQSHESKEIKHQIEAEFTKNGLKRLKKLVTEGNLKMLAAELELVLEDLNALYFAEHATKTRQVEWIARVLNKHNPREESKPIGRLDNEAGSYMRDIIYDTMNNTH